MRCCLHRSTWKQCSCSTLELQNSGCVLFVCSRPTDGCSSCDPPTHLLAEVAKALQLHEATKLHDASHLALIHRPQHRLTRQPLLLRQWCLRCCGWRPRVSATASSSAAHCCCCSCCSWPGACAIPVAAAAAAAVPAVTPIRPAAQAPAQAGLLETSVKVSAVVRRLSHHRQPSARPMGCKATSSRAALQWHTTFVQPWLATAHGLGIQASGGWSADIPARSVPVSVTTC